MCPLWVRSLSLSLMLLRFIPEVFCINSLFLLNSIPLYRSSTVHSSILPFLDLYCFQLLALIKKKKVAVNILVQVMLQTYVFISFVYMSGFGIANLQSIIKLSLHRHFLLDFLLQSDLNILHFTNKCMEVLVVPYLYQHLV